MEVTGKTALVTGGASGIGLACVKELLRHGAKVAICDYNDMNSEKILEEIRNEFGPDKAIFIKTDVTDKKEFEDAFKVTVSTFKTLDIVLNNAGITDFLDWEKTIAVNLTAVVRGIKLAFQYMGKNNGGRGGILCNTASVVGMMPVATTPIYCATKHAVIGLTRSYGLPLYMEKTGVRVVALCPGMTDTPLMDDVKAIPMEDNDAASLAQDMSMFTTQKAENVASAMMVLLKTAGSGTIWVSEENEPVYEVAIPEYRSLRLVKS